MGGELLDSRARVSELKAECIKDKQGFNESVRQLLASSQTQQQASLDALGCAAEAEKFQTCSSYWIKKLEILAEVEHDPLDAREQNQEQKCTGLVQEQKIEDKKHTWQSLKKRTHSSKSLRTSAKSTWRQMNAVLNGQLETLKFEFQRQRDSDKVVANKYEVDLTVAQETNAVLSDLTRIKDDLRVQLSLQDPAIPLEVHEKATDRLKEQGRMIADLTRQATTLAARYKEGKLASHHFYIRTIPDKEDPGASREQGLVSKANDIRRMFKSTL
ncbi:hypothetical protein FIBSPDRAFT_1004197 [Athelia psychrophila]|uniref:Uncharacterized protein n=1 Tax=Athelia psychrophila TaxID=1759441 RepID=A0A167W2X7_9AGAM|nr:hypothetical protein FIBSPDRAFT_1004197 [Fibularhizoctonia sp. CBS 109695]